MSENLCLNVLLLGEALVGKSSLQLRCSEREYNEFMPQILFNVLGAEININDNNVDLLLWDTPGLDKFRPIVRTHFKRANGMILVYDVTRLETFAALPSWLSYFRTENEIAPVILVGNKCDKEDSQERVPDERVKKFCDQHKLDFFEASAKTGENVNEIFETLTRKMITSISMLKTKTLDASNGIVQSPRNLHSGNSIISLHETNPTQKPKNKCY